MGDERSNANDIRTFFYSKTVHIVISVPNYSCAKQSYKSTHFLIYIFSAEFFGRVILGVQLYVSFGSTGLSKTA